MVNLFGLDIKRIVADAVLSSGGLQNATLLKVSEGSRDSSNPTLRSSSTEEKFSVQATIQMKEFRRNETAIPETIVVALLIAGTFTPATTPSVNDRLEVAGVTYTLVRLIRTDPAGATYEFEVK